MLHVLRRIIGQHQCSEIHVAVLQEVRTQQPGQKVKCA